MFDSFKHTHSKSFKLLKSFSIKSTTHTLFFFSPKPYTRFANNYMFMLYFPLNLIFIFSSFRFVSFSFELIPRSYVTFFISNQIEKNPIPKFPFVFILFEIPFFFIGFRSFFLLCLFIYPA